MSQKIVYVVSFLNITKNKARILGFHLTTEEREAYMRPETAQVKGNSVPAGFRKDG